MQRNHYTEYQVNTIVRVFHFGRPDEMKVVGHDHEKGLVKLQYTTPEYGVDFKSCETLNKMDLQCQEYESLRKHRSI